uniref:Uncharacterized protein n=1 Tax=Myoviridae sp. ctwwN25 TaxID=2825209 RepID=A0A8S5PQF6_9CAUD|nr:MAG TPA: hypothetical protein [Myoviridae sp. ctwwN25]
MSLFFIVNLPYNRLNICFRRYKILKKKGSS